ncbi:MAG: GAF domain-containing protein, partial [Chloroflexi bacterium]|nr:GAF domain-containing protein [Chloroflexota bacterium]
GGEVPYTDGKTVTLPPTSYSDVLAELEAVRASWYEMRLAIADVLQNDPQSAAFAAAAARVDSVSPRLLAEMDEAVRLFQADAEADLAKVELIQIGLLAMVALIVFAAIVVTQGGVLRPISELEAAARLIGVGDLETPISAGGLAEVRDLARSLDEMRRRLKTQGKTQSALLELSRHLLEASDESAVANRAVEVAASALETEFSAVVLPDAEGRLLARAVRGWPAEFAGLELGRGDASQTGYTVLQGKAVSVEDYSRELAFVVHPLVREQGIASGLSVPMLFEGRVVGAMLVHSRSRRRFGDDEIQLLSLIANQTAVALERARSRAEAEMRAEELGMLARVGEALNRAQTAEETLQLVLAEAVKLVNQDRGSVMLVDPETRTLRILVSVGLPDEEVRAFNARRLRADEGTFADSVGRGKMVEVADTSSDPRVVRDYTDTFTGQLTNVPLRTGHAAIGVIALDGLPRDDRARRLLRALADLAAIAIEKARLLEETLRRADQLRARHEASRAFASELRLDVVLQSAVETARRLAQARYAALAVVAGDGGLAHFRTAGLSETERQMIGEPPVGDGLIGAVLKEGAPIRLHDLRRDPRSVGFPPHHPQMTTLLSVPVIVRGAVTGGLYLSDKENGLPFTPEDEALLVGLADDAAIAIENARLFQSERAQAQRQEALFRLSADLAASLDVAESCRRVVDRLGDALGYANLGLFLLDEDTGVRRLAASAGWADVSHLQRIPPGQGLSERPLLDGQLHYTPDVTRDPRYVPGLNSGSEVDVPIPIGGKVAGVLCVESSRPNSFDRGDFDVLTAAANLAGVAIGRARLVASERRRADELDALRATLADISGELDLPRLLQAVLDRALALLDAIGGNLSIFDPARAELVIAVERNMGKNYVGTRVALGEGASGRVAESCEPLIVPDYPNWEGRGPKFADGPWRALLVVPLLLGGRVLGTLSAYHTDPARQFTSADLRLINLFASQAAVAMENARLYDETQSRLTELSALGRVSRRLAATLDLGEVENLVVEEAINLTGATHGSVAIFLEDEQALEVRVMRGFTSEQASRMLGARLHVGEGLHGRLIQTGQAVLVNDVTQDPDYLEVGRAIRSEFIVPIKKGETLVGALNLESPRVGAFSEADVRLVTALADQIAIAIENARLYKSAVQAAESRAILHRASQEISTSLDPEQVYAAIHHAASQLMPSEAFVISLLDEARHDIESVYLVERTGRAPNQRIPINRGLSGRVISTGETLLIKDVAAESNLDAVHFGDPNSVQSILAVPMRRGEKVMGMLSAQCYRADAYTPDDAQTLSTLANQAAVAIENARLFSQVIQRTEELGVLYESSAAIARTLDLSAVLGNIAEQMTRVVQGTSAYVQSIDWETSQTTILAEYFGPDANELERVSVVGERYDLRDHPQIIRALQEGRTLTMRVSDPNTDHASRMTLQQAGGRSALLVPLLSADRALGYALLWDSRQDRIWTEAEARLCQTLATNAGIALENARLFAEVRRLAITDDLTGVHTRRHFFELGDREFDRAKRYRRALSAIMFDIDSFKQVNDTFGHALGDQVLRVLALRCRENLREIDLLGRYGGEEFAAILPEVDLVGAHNAAERLRRCVADMPFDGPNCPLTVTISLGIAALGGACPDLAALLDQADSALYIAKNSGRNRVGEV